MDSGTLWSTRVHQTWVPIWVNFKKQAYWYLSLVDLGTAQSTRVLQTRVSICLTLFSQKKKLPLHTVLESLKLEYLVPTFLTPTTGINAQWMVYLLTKPPSLAVSYFPISICIYFCLALAKSMWRVRMPEWKWKQKLLLGHHLQVSVSVFFHWRKTI